MRPHHGDHAGEAGDVTPTGRVLGTGDFNGDGATDLLWRERFFPRVTLLDGSSASTSGNIVVPGHAWAFRRGDLWGVGKPGRPAAERAARRHRGLQRRWQVRHPVAPGRRPAGALVCRRKLEQCLGELGQQPRRRCERHRPSPEAPVPVDWQVQGIGDFNGDGYSDILWRHDGRQVAIWYMEHAMHVGDGYPGGELVAECGKIQAVGDFDGDGRRTFCGATSRATWPFGPGPVPARPCGSDWQNTRLDRWPRVADPRRRGLQRRRPRRHPVAAHRRHRVHLDDARRNLPRRISAAAYGPRLAAPRPAGPGPATPQPAVRPARDSRPGHRPDLVARPPGRARLPWRDPARRAVLRWRSGVAGAQSLGSGRLHIPTKQKRHSTDQGAKKPFDHQRPEKNGSWTAPSATSFRTPSECHDCRRPG